MTQFQTNRFVSSPVNVLSPVTPDAQQGAGRILSASVAFADQQKQRDIASKNRQVAREEIAARERLQKLTLSAGKAESELEAQLARESLTQQEKQFEADLSQRQKEFDETKPQREAETQLTRQRIRTEREQSEIMKVNSQLQLAQSQRAALLEEREEAIAQGHAEAAADLASQLEENQRQLQTNIRHAGMLRQTQRTNLTEMMIGTELTVNALRNNAEGQAKKIEQQGEAVKDVINTLNVEVQSAEANSGFFDTVGSAVDDLLGGVESLANDIPGLEVFASPDMPYDIEKADNRFDSQLLDSRRGRIFRLYRRDGEGSMQRFGEVMVEKGVVTEEQDALINEVVRATVAVNYAESFSPMGSDRQAAAVGAARERLDAARAALDADPAAKSQAYLYVNAVDELGQQMSLQEGTTILTPRAGDNEDARDLQRLGSLASMTANDLTDYDQPDFLDAAEDTEADLDNIRAAIQSGEFGDTNVLIGELESTIAKFEREGIFDGPQGPRIRRNIEKLYRAMEEGKGLTDRIELTGSKIEALTGQVSVLASEEDAILRDVQAQIGADFEPRLGELNDIILDLGLNLDAGDLEDMVTEEAEG